VHPSLRAVSAQCDMERGTYFSGMLQKIIAIYELVGLLCVPYRLISCFFCFVPTMFGNTRGRPERAPRKI